MAKTRINGVNGGVTFPSGIGIDPMSWSLEFDQQVDDTSNYSDSPAAAGTANGSGVYSATYSVTGVLAEGATGTTPGAPSSLTSGGGSYTLTAYTGCTYGFTGIISRYSISHRKVAGAQVATISGRTTGAITETWATS